VQQKVRLVVPVELEDAAADEQRDARREVDGGALEEADGQVEAVGEGAL
jgi:hypothetical protein